MLRWSPDALSFFSFSLSDFFFSLSFVFPLLEESCASAQGRGSVMFQCLPWESGWWRGAKRRLTEEKRLMVAVKRRQRGGRQKMENPIDTVGAWAPGQYGSVSSPRVDVCRLAADKNSSFTRAHSPFCSRFPVSFLLVSFGKETKKKKRDENERKKETKTDR